MNKLVLGAVVSAFVGLGCAVDPGAEALPEGTGEATEGLNSIAPLVGQLLFFDTNLSSPGGQSCASCHAPFHAFTDPNTSEPTSEGVIPGRFGSRNAPTVLYAQFSPSFHFSAGAGRYIGGMFRDGRASTLEDQAKGPFLNPLEMNNPNKAAVVSKVKTSWYAPLFKTAFGPGAFADTDSAYDHIAEAIAAFERTKLFAPFSSKYDAYLAGHATLRPAEARGLALFETHCSTCHPSQPSADGTPPLFTRFSYANLGLPKNPHNPYYHEPQFNPAGAAYLDEGLGGIVGDPSLYGAFKVPTLRNLSRSAPYMHSGLFKTTKEVVHFYNTRDTAPGPAPEFPATMTTAVGNMGLSKAQENDIATFLGTLEDGWWIH